MKRLYRDVFSSEDGQIVLEHMCKLSGLTRPEFVTDPQEALCRERLRHFMASILNLAGENEDFITRQLRKELENESEQMDEF